MIAVVMGIYHGVATLGQYPYGVTVGQPVFATAIAVGRFPPKSINIFEEVVAISVMQPPIWFIPRCTVILIG